MEQISAWLMVNPMVSFTIFLLASLTVPPLIERLRLPGLVGLLLAGIVLGPYGLQLLSPETETVKLLSDIGKVYLMFVAGLEIDMGAFQKNRNRSLTFGLLTFAVPLIVGTGLGLWMNMGWNAAVVLGSLLASHTLLAYPLLQRLGVARNEAVTVTVGATIFTDIGALLLLAVCVAIHRGEFTWLQLLWQLVTLGLYGAVVLIGLDRLGKVYFRRTGNDEGNQFLFTLLALFLASVGAQVVHTENIVGAFLAGLAVSDVLGRSAVKEKVEFVGSVLFIPFFFIAMGLLIEVPVFVDVLLTNSATVVAIVTGLMGSKFLATWGLKQIYRYSWPETLTMWSLSLPQVAATLAAAMVGYEIGLLSEVVFNSVIVLMLVTSTVGPVLTRRYAGQLTLANPQSAREPVPETAAAGQTVAGQTAAGQTSTLNVLVPVHNPETEPYLVEMAGLLVKHHQGKLFPLAVAQPATSLKSPDFSQILDQSRQRLAEALAIGQRLGVATQPILRVDHDVAAGICHASSEQSVQLTVMGYGELVTLQARLLGSVVAQVFRGSPSTVAVMQLRCPPMELQRIVVPIWDMGLYAQVRFHLAQQLAIATQCAIAVVCICSPYTSTDEQTTYRQHLLKGLQALPNAPKLPRATIQMITHTDIVAAVLAATQDTDLVILHSRELLPVREVPTDDWGILLLHKLTCSVALIEEPGP